MEIKLDLYWKLLKIGLKSINNDLSNGKKWFIRISSRC